MRAGGQTGLRQVLSPTKHVTRRQFLLRRPGFRLGNQRELLASALWPAVRRFSLRIPQSAFPTPPPPDRPRPHSLSRRFVKLEAGRLYGPAPRTDFSTV